MGEKKVRNNIRKLRFANNEMTQEQLAIKAGVTRQTIIAIESGKYAPSLELAFRIALAFDIPLSEVFSYAADDEAGQV
jgi:putative transcriptional regulator